MQHWLLGALFATAACFHDLPPKGAVYFVAPDGDDGEVGAFSRPFRTIGRAVKLLGPGDAVYVRSGTYLESLGEMVPSGTSWARAVTLAAYPGETVTIRPQPGGSRAFDFYGVGYVVIEGFTLDGSQLQFEVVKGGCSYDAANKVIPGTCVHHVRFKNCKFMNSPVTCIFFTGDDNEFIGVEVSACGLSKDPRNPGGAMNLAGNHNLLEHSSFHDTAWGIQFYDSSGLGTSGNTLRANRFFHIGMDAELAPEAKGAALVVYGGVGNKIYNDLIYDNFSGLQLGNRTESALVAHNTIYGNQGLGVDVGGITGSRGAIVKNNISYGNLGTMGNQLQGEGTVIGDNITENEPKVVDAAGGDFHLQAKSPALDRGGLIPEVTEDFDGIRRPQGRAVDLGAFERPQN